MSQIKRTQHLDGSECILRKKISKRSQIAYHWRYKLNQMGIFMDWAEPSCWACGHYASPTDREKKADFDSMTEKEIFQFWDDHIYLERCHVIPKGLGGCSCDGNIVLLCKSCHRENPDTNDPELFFRWMRNKPKESYPMKRVRELTKALEDFDMEASALHLHTIIGNYKFLDFVDKNSVKVRGSITDASMVTCLIGYKKMFNDTEMANQIENKLIRNYVLKEINSR